jgi:hypothetical protein
MKTRRNISRETGTTLIITLTTTGILGTVLATYMVLTSQENLKVKRSIGWNAALPMAEAGIEDACSHLSWNPTNFDWSSDGWAINTNSGAYNKTRFLGDGYYSTDIDGWVGGVVTITSKGYAAWTGGSNYISRTVVVNAQTPTPVYPSGLIAFNIDFGGTFNADSFDSRTNLYSTGGQYDPKKRTANALVASRPGSTGFNVAGTVDIRGNVATGPGGIVTVSGSGIVGDLAYNTKGTIQPGHVTNNFNTVYPPVPFIPFNTNSGSTRIATSGTNGSGTTFNYVLTNAHYNYYLPSVAAGSTMFVSVPGCRLWIQGGTDIPVITFDNNPTNPPPTLQLLFGGPNLTLPKNDCSFNNSPPQYWLIGLPSCASLKWTGGTFIGVIYAPTMALSSQGNADLQGAIVANSFACTGTFDFHYDAATGETKAKPFQIIAWAEQ